MSSCLPFMLLSSSIPLTLQSDISDPGFHDLATDQRPDSRLSGPRPATVDIQPSRTPSPTDELQRDRKNILNLQRRNIPRSVPTLRRQRSRHLRYTEAAPPVPQLPAIHEQWIGTRETGGNGHTRRTSDPVRNSTPMFQLGDLPLSSRRSSDPPSARSSATLPSIRLSLTSRLSTASTLAPSPAPGSDNRNSLNPPSPSLTTLEEDVVLQLPEFQREAAASEDGEGGSYESGPFVTVASEPSSLVSTASVNERSELTGIHRRASKVKSVSFSADVPQIILSPDNVLEDNKPLRRQSSWSGLFQISAPPVAAKPPLTRQMSMPTVRGQAAGKSCLKRTSSFQDSDGTAETPDVSPPAGVTPRVTLRRSRSSQDICFTSLPPQLSMPQIPEFPSLDVSTVIMHNATPQDAVEVSNDENQTTESNASPRPSQTIVVTPRPRKPEPTLSVQQKAVRHWSMTGDGWVRRSGVYANGSGPVTAARDAPPVPRLPINMGMLRI